MAPPDGENEKSEPIGSLLFPGYACSAYRLSATNGNRVLEAVKVPRKIIAVRQVHIGRYSTHQGRMCQEAKSVIARRVETRSIETRRSNPLMSESFHKP
jgi:hypothetical protein